MPRIYRRKARKNTIRKIYRFPLDKRKFRAIMFVENTLAGYLEVIYER